MISFDDATGENRKEHNPNWPHNPDYPYRILILGGSGPGKTNSLLILINHKSYIDKIYLYAKDPYEAKYQLLIQKHESVGIAIIILKFLLNILMKWMMFMKTLINIIQIKNTKFSLYLI